jgi:hypothetical protein
MVVVRVRKLSFCLDRYIVAQNGRETVEVALFMGHGDQPPVAASSGNFSDEDGAAASSACPDAGAM